MAYIKGAFINLGAGLLGDLPNIVIFQFNPERVSRTPSLAQPPDIPFGAGFVNARQQASGPTESYSFTLNLDASDQLAAVNTIALTTGILPALSALEMLMIPFNSLNPDLAALANPNSCDTWINPPLELPTVLFFWGPYRIWPVTVNNLSITETEYDQLLNPIRAEVQVSLQVLTDNQAGTALELGAYRYSLAQKQMLAALNLANNAAMGISGALPFSLPF
jgi:hypothetical protein